MEKLIKNLLISVAKPGIIKSKAAKAIAAPEKLHKLEFHFCLIE